MDYPLLFAAYRAKPQAKQSQQRLLYLCLRDAILSGQLSAGTRLLGSRSLAAELSVARNSVLYAYEQLATEGLIYSQNRASFVALTVPAAKVVQPALASSEPIALAQRAQLSAWPSEPHGVFTAFMPGVPALSAFPLALWRRYMARAWRNLSSKQLDYGEVMGEPALRAAIASHLTATRGVSCRAEQILITDGTQHSLDLCAHALASAGERVWIENPGYGGALQAFNGAELVVQGIAVDVEGLAPTAADWRDSPPKLIYTTPSHQFPLGRVMTSQRRMELIEQAQQQGSWIIEDDYDSEFRRDGPPLPAMQGLVEQAPVIYLGTFSKTLFPALRIGFMLVPEGLLVPLTSMLQRGSLRGRCAEQLALAEFLRSGQFVIHLRKMRRLYAARRDALVTAIERHLGQIATIHGGSSGIHLAIELPPNYLDHQISDAALAHGVYSQPLSRLATGPVLYNGLMLGYAQVPEQQMEHYVRLLAQVIRSVV